MNLRRTAVLAAVLFATSAAVAPPTSASAEAGQREWVCLVTATAS